MSSFYKPDLCIFNLPKWFLLSATNFFTLQTLLVLILTLLKSNTERAQSVRFGLTAFLYLAYIPWVMLYNMFGGFAIQNGDSKYARENHQHCVSTFLALLPLLSYFLLIAIELLAFFFLGYALRIRFKHFMQTQALLLPENQGKLKTWSAAIDFAWQSIYSNVTLMQYMEDIVLTREHQRRYSDVIRELKTCKYPATYDSAINSNSEINDDIEEDDEEQVALRKYVECTICIGNFMEGQEVIMMPKCQHVFHKSCVKRWVAVRLRCPNCNMELAPDSDYLLQPI
ncbi:hypothetical protein FGO68_gene12810 [Halteria grandinella]|uniref:RING-type domain-containing protein n=1 Tax=Halteria grandinella TaxID=5974 RepID=A0A8J8NXP2_HALGN|nr:hypothetical protein FGO68_gene12810 [Halteria grandinella]